MMMYGYNNNPVGYGYSNYSNLGSIGYQQPQMQMPIQQQMQMPIPEATTDGTIWVQGDTGARAYRVIPNNSVVLRNSENPDIIYIKSADSKGIPSTEIFIKQNSTEKKPVDDEIKVDYVTKSEFDNLKSRFENFINNVKESKGDKK